MSSTTQNRAIAARRAGFTAVELLMVLVILVALASMLVPLLRTSVNTPQGEKSAEQLSTEVSMERIRAAIMGDSNGPGMWTDVGQRAALFPQRLSLLFAESSPFPIRTFDPITRTGWRGPYLQQASGKDILGNPTIIDAWGNSLVLQVDFDSDGQVNNTEARYARLVSAGPDQVLDTPLNVNDMIPGSNAGAELTLDESNDDIILFFRTTDTRQ